VTALRRSPARSTSGRLVGSLFGVGAAVAYGIVVVVQRSLAKEDLPVTTVVGGRYAIASVILMGVLAVSGRPLRPEPGERARAALLGLVGYVVHSTLFYLALAHGTAAAVAMVFYLYPAVVAVLEVALRLRPPRPAVLLAPVLSGIGVAVVVASGERVALSGTGVLLGLGAALAVSVYLLTSSHLIRRSNPMVTAAWVAGGVAVSMATGGVALAGFRLPAGSVGRLLLAGLATAAATTCVYASLQRLGAGPTAVFMALQSLVALVLAAVTLDEPMTAAQVVGGAALVAGAALAATRGRTPAAEAAAPAADTPTP
jgi:drug/metabolite transporter (DMT)-like permease